MLRRDLGAGGVRRKAFFGHSFAILRNEVEGAGGLPSLPWSVGQPLDCDIGQQIVCKIGVGAMLGVLVIPTCCGLHNCDRYIKTLTSGWIVFDGIQTTCRAFG